MSNPLSPSDVRDHREHDWFWANNSVIDRYGAAIGADGVAVYMALARHADRNGQCFPSYATLAERLGLSRPTIMKCIERLKIAGLITSMARTKPSKTGTERPDSNLYTLLTVPPLSDAARAALKETIKAHEGGKGDLLGRSQNDPSKGGLPPLPSKGGLPPLVKEIDYGGKAGLLGVVNDVDSNKTHGNQTHTTPTPCVPESENGGGGGDNSFYQELRRRKVGQTKAKEIAAMAIDRQATLAAIDRLSATRPLGGIINDIIDGVLPEKAPPVARANPPPPAPRAVLTTAQRRALAAQYDPFKKESP